VCAFVGVACCVGCCGGGICVSAMHCAWGLLVFIWFVLLMAVLVPRQDHGVGVVTG